MASNNTRYLRLALTRIKQARANLQTVQEGPLVDAALAHLQQAEQLILDQGQLDPDAPPVPAGRRPRQGVDYGCGNKDCVECYEVISTHPRGGTE